MQKKLSNCKRNLAILWFLSSGLLFFIIFLQTIFGKYQDHESEVWSWTLQTFMPTISLIISVFIVDAFRTSKEEKQVDSFFYRLAFALSLCYLILAILTILLQPFATTFGNVTPLELIKKSGLWLGPLQGLVGASLGVFFLKSAHDDKKNTD